MPSLDRILELRRSGQLGPGEVDPSDELRDLFTFYGINPTSPEANIIRQRIEGGELAGDVFLEFAALMKTGPFSDTGGTGSAPAFSSTKAAADLRFQQQQTLDAEARAFQANQDRLNREEDARQAEIDRELRLRESRLTTARDLVGLRSAEAREARTQGTQLAGSDPFRFLAVARGLQPPTGQTPTAGFKENLLGAAQFQSPDLTGLDSNALQSVIQKLSQSNAPQGSATLGFAHGGIVSPTGGATPTGGSQAITVGESGPEIMILRPDGSVEVVPMAGSAQEGGVFDLGGFGPLFQRLRTSAGIGSQFNPGFESGDVLDRARSKFGFLPVGGEQETDAPFQAFAGPLLNVRSGLNEAFRFQGLSGGAASAEALRISGIIKQLPAPFKIPPTFFNSLFPAEQSALISAYRFAGVPEDDFRHLLAAPQLSANPQRATAVG